MRRWSWLPVWIAGLTLLYAGTTQAEPEGDVQEVPPKVRGLLAALDSPDPEVAGWAVEQLVEEELKVPEVRQKLQTLAQGSRVSELLGAQGARSRLGALLALRELGPGAVKHAPQLVELLRDPEARVQEAAAEAVGALGPAGAALAPQLEKLLRDPEWRVRVAAARAVGALGPAGAALAPQLEKLLRDPEGPVREAVAEAVGALGPAGAALAPQLAELLRDPEDLVRAAAVEAMGALGPTTAEVISQVIKIQQKLDNKNCNSIFNITPADPKVIADALAATSDASASERPCLRLIAYIASGGISNTVALLHRLARPHEQSVSPPTSEEAHSILNAADNLWSTFEKHSATQKLLAAQIAEVASLARSHWTESDITLLERHEQRLRPLHPMHADTVGASITAIKRWNLAKMFSWGWLWHVAFWLSLIFAYPRWPQVQAIFFFWNPWVRQIAGIGYVGFLLTWVPWLRRRLLAPFKSSLVEDAQLEKFSSKPYFEQAEVIIPPSQQRVALLSMSTQFEGKWRAFEHGR